MNKKIVAGVLIIMGALILSQSAMVYATKPESMLWIMWTSQVDDVNMFYKDGLLWMVQMKTSGEMWKAIFDPVGDYTALTTSVFYYDRNGDIKFVIHTQEITITSGYDTLNMVAKLKDVEGRAPVGSWTIVDGTGIFSALSGRGEWVYPDHYYGKIK